MRFYSLLFVTLLVCNDFEVKAQAVSNFVGLTPCRVVDTREEERGSLGPPALLANAQRDLPILQSSCNIPANALAYALNITVVPHGSLPYLTVWPTGQAQPSVSTLNSFQGSVVANAAIVPAGTSGSLSVYAAGNTDLIVDITGYFAPQSTSSVDQMNQQMGQINQQITQINQQIAQQDSQLNQQIGQVNLQGSQLAQQISQQTALVSQHSTQISQTNQQVAQLTQQITPLAQQISQQTALVSQHSTQISQTNQQVAQLTQQITPLAQQISQVNQEAALVSQQTTQVGQQVAQISQLSQRAALLASAGGNNNVGLGIGAFSSNLSGDSNIAIGSNAGSGLAHTNSSIEIGNVGQPGDNGIIRIGTPGTHQKAFVAGIAGTGVNIGDMVLVDQDGQLGTIQSSVRYKEDIQNIGSSSDALMNLRPVRFRYKRSNPNGEKPLQYGLIAEEVAKVFPELVVHNQQGEIETVQYHQLPALLLNEIQKQHLVIDQQCAELQREREELQKQRSEMRDLLARIAVLESQVEQQR